MKNDKKLRVLLSHCDRKFYPYIEKVLDRLPEEVRNKEVILDSKLKLISLEAHLSVAFMFRSSLPSST